MLAAIGEFFALLMKGCYSIIPNYGWAIILFTLSSKMNGEQYIRIAVRDDEDNNILFRKLME